jgi:hypothetical protein
MDVMTRLSAAAAALLVLVSTADSGYGTEPDGIPSVLTNTHFDENVPPPLAGNSGGCPGGCEENFARSYHGSQSSEKRYAVRFRGGATYFDSPSDDLFGGTYGADVGVHLSGDWGFMAYLSMNQITNGTQVLGTFGVVKLPNFEDCQPASPVVFSLLFDQYSDTRIDELYLAQLRLQLGYAINPTLETGLIYYQPTIADDDVVFVDTRFGLASFGTLEFSQGLSAYVATKVGNARVSGQVGFRDDPDTMTLMSSVLVPVSDNSNVFANLSYAEVTGSWATSVGIEFLLGPGPAERLPDRSTVVRAQSPTADFRPVVHLNLPQGGQGDEQQDESYSAGDINPNLDQQTTQTFFPPRRPSPTNRWLDNYGQSSWRGLNLSYGVETAIISLRQPSNLSHVPINDLVWGVPGTNIQVRSIFGQNVQPFTCDSFTPEVLNRMIDAANAGQLTFGEINNMLLACPP